MEGIPEGFEVYENPNARVFLRKVQPKTITDEEVEVVKRGLGQSRHLRHYQSWAVAELAGPAAEVAPDGSSPEPPRDSRRGRLPWH